jgi:hypothetical protein
MDRNSLRKFIDRSQVRSQVLSGYTGAYSLGVTADPQDPGEAVLLLRVATSDTSRFERGIWLGGAYVEIIVRSGYVEPLPHSNLQPV